MNDQNLFIKFHPLHQSTDAAVRERLILLVEVVAHRKNITVLHTLQRRSKEIPTEAARSG
jgi:hypothetical protein